MKRYQLLGLVVAGALGGAAGCGDNAISCGTGTVDMGGMCVPTSQCGSGTMQTSTGSCIPVCTNGTKLDPTTGQCQIDPTACQGGTILINNICQPPDKGLTVDLEEGPEPNGLGLLGEVSQAPAGTIGLRAVGQPSFVIHGTINPFEDLDGDGQLDPDVDSYAITVNSPALINIKADGLGGLAAGFVSVAAVNQADPLATWQRFGVNLLNTTSKRQVFLPRAGTYIIAIADTRTLFLGGAAAGGANAEYYVSIDLLDQPTPTPLTFTSGVATVTDSIDSDVKFYSGQVGLGFNDAVLTTPATDVQMNPAIDLMKNTTTFRQQASQSAGFFGNTPAEIIAGGFAASDTATYVVDYTFNYRYMPAPFTLTVTTTTATPLLPSPADAIELSSNPNTATSTAAFLGSLNQYYFDVTAAGEIEGLALQWNHPVHGSLFNENGFNAAQFTGFGVTGATWTDYKGLLRMLAPGRYYFAVYDSTGTPGTTHLIASAAVTGTATVAALTPAAITEGTPLTAQAVGPYNSVPYTYSAGTTDAWQLFNSSGTNTGGQLVSFFNPASTFGRLDALTASTGTLGAQGTPLFTSSAGAAGGGVGRILLDDPTTNFLVKVNAVAPNGAATFGLDFKRRADATHFIDMGTVAAGTTMTANNLPVANGDQARGYVLFRTAAGNRVSITNHEHVATPAFDAQFQRVNNDETGASNVVNTAGVGNDVEAFLQSGNGWTAYVVTPVVPAQSGQVDDTVNVQAPVMYSVAADNTAFTDICATGGGGVPISFTPDGGGAPCVTGCDDGLSASFPSPTGFTFFGLAAPNFVVSTNGFLSFDTTIPDSSFINANMPDPGVPNAVVAPYWQDLNQLHACSKVVSATKTIIQWSGQTFSGAKIVETQAILDATDKSITFLWGATETALGDRATIGIEDQVGGSAKVIGNSAANSITAGSGKKLTPM